MWKTGGITMILWLVTVTCPAFGENPEMKGNPDAVQKGSAPPAPVSLGLSLESQVILKETMREHLEALQEIVGTIAQGDYKKAAQITREKLGFEKHHQVMQREKGTTYPSKYQELAMAHHREAEELANSISTGEAHTIFQHLDRTIQSCVACHRAYKE
jgi:hypothetical protein